MECLQLQEILKVSSLFLSFFYKFENFRRRLLISCLFFTRADAAVPAPNADLEEQDISIYCAGYLTHALVILFLEGLILRLATLLALYVCPRGLNLEPLVVGMSSIWKKIKESTFGKKVAAAKRRTATVTGGGAV